MRAIQRGCHNGRLRGTQSCPAPLDLQRRFSWTTADLGVTAEHKCPPSNVKTYNHRRKTALSSQRDATLPPTTSSSRTRKAPHNEIPGRISFLRNSALSRRVRRHH